MSVITAEYTGQDGLPLDLSAKAVFAEHPSSAPMSDTLQQRMHTNLFIPTTLTSLDGRCGTVGRKKITLL